MDPSAFSEHAPGRLVTTTDALGRSGQAFVPDPLPPRADYGSRQLRVALSSADQELTRLDGIARQIQNPESLFANYLRREAVLSSAIEGTHTTLADLVVFEATRRKASDDDPIVESYVRALHFGRDRVSELPIGKSLFLELHQMLMERTEHSETRPGEIRDCQVFIGRPTFHEARFVPPPPVFIDDLLENLAEYLRSENEAALIKLAIAHYQFEAIHPFRDGNGRVGRLMISLWLHRQAVLTAPMLYLSAYFENRKDEYYDALLRVSTDGDWEPWLIFFLRGVAQQSNDAWNRTLRLAALRDEYKSRLSGPRASVGPQILVDELFSIPLLSVPSAARLLGVTYAAAKNSVQKLIDAQILAETPVAVGGTAYYVARELISIVDAPLD